MNNAAANVSARRGFPPHALILEDDETLLQRFKHILSHEAFDTHHARTSRHALKTLKGRRFDLIVIDLRLLDSHSIKAVSRIKAEHHETAVVLVSGADSPEATETVLRRGIHEARRSHALRGRKKNESTTAIGNQAPAANPPALYPPAPAGDEYAAFQGTAVNRVLEKVVDDPVF